MLHFQVFKELSLFLLIHKVFLYCNSNCCILMYSLLEFVVFFSNK